MEKQTSMITRVGGAILLAETEWTPKSGVSKEQAMGLAAIEAMREPTEAMLIAGARSRTASDRFASGDDTLAPDYMAMIDAALAGA